MLNKRQRKLMRIVLAAWLQPGTVTFDEWCAAVDELYPETEVR
jgi:hypothetical protein